jgi:hypothetical protein
VFGPSLWPPGCPGPRLIAPLGGSRPREDLWRICPREDLCRGFVPGRGICVRGEFVPVGNLCPWGICECAGGSVVVGAGCGVALAAARRRFSVLAKIVWPGLRLAKIAFGQDWVGRGLRIGRVRAISTGRLRGLLRFHFRPINVVVFHGSRRDLVLRRVSRLDAFSGYPVRT